VAWLRPIETRYPRFLCAPRLEIRATAAGQDVASARARRISLRPSCKASETAIFAGLLAAQGTCLAPLQWADPNSMHPSPWKPFAGLARTDFMTKPLQTRRRD